MAKNNKRPARRKLNSGKNERKYFFYQATLPSKVADAFSLPHNYPFIECYGTKPPNHVRCEVVIAKSPSSARAQMDSKVRKRIQQQLGLHSSVPVKLFHNVNP
jgi:hypothetical protein